MAVWHIAAMAEPLDQIGAAVPFRRLARIRLVLAALNNSVRQPMISERLLKGKRRSCGLFFCFTGGIDGQ